MSKRWANACPERRQAEMVLQTAIQDNFPYIMAICDLLDEGSVKVRRMRAFAVVNEIER